MKPIRSVLASAAAISCAVAFGATIAWTAQSSATTSAAPSIYTVTASGTVAASLYSSVAADCNPGDKATGGGYSWAGVTSPEQNGVVIDNSIPLNAPKHNGGWTVTAFNSTGESITLDTYAQCLKRS